jgi:hypothetical protein
MADPELDPLFESTFAATIIPEMSGMEASGSAAEEVSEGEDGESGESGAIKAEDFLISFVEF